jgi:hypothetical protein
MFLLIHIDSMSKTHIFIITDHFTFKMGYIKLTGGKKNNRSLRLSLIINIQYVYNSYPPSCWENVSWIMINTNHHRTMSLFFIGRIFIARFKKTPFPLSSNFQIRKYPLWQRVIQAVIQNNTSIYLQSWS